MESPENNTNDAEQNIDFLREQIKQRPINKKRLFRRTLITVALAVVFGVVACLVFLLILPVLNNRINPEPVPETVSFPEERDEMQPEEMVETDAEIETGVAAAAVAQNLQQSVFEQLMDSYDYRVQDIERLYDTLSGVAEDAASSLVTATNAGNLYCGLIIADNEIDTLVLLQTAALQRAGTVALVFPDGNTYEATLKMHDTLSGLCVVGVPNSALTEDTRDAFRIADLGSSVYSATVGTPVIAVGAPSGAEKSLSYGILTSDPYPVALTDSSFQLLPTDIYAPVSASGVLVDFKGRVLGWIDMSHNPADFRNRLSAVGITELKPLISHLSNEKPRVTLGVLGSTVPADVKEAQSIPDGAYITSVVMDSPAMTVGIQAGDIISRIDGISLTDYPALCTALLNYESADTVSLTVLRERGGSFQEMEITVALDATNH